MASSVKQSESQLDGEKSIEDLLRSLCEEGLVRHLIKSKYQEFLLRLVVSTGSTAENKTLSKDSPTYLHRLCLTQTFLKERKQQSQKIYDTEKFYEDLVKYLTDKQSSCKDQELIKEKQEWWRVSLLEEGCSGVVNGVVLRRSPQYAAVYVCDTCYAIPNPEREPGVADEIVVSLPDNFPGFRVAVKIGDVLSVRLTNGLNGIEDVHVSLKSCYSLSTDETEHFLGKAEVILKTEGAADALASILSCFAVWSHVVEERCRGDEQVTEKVLTLCCNVVDECGKRLYETSFEEFLKPFVDSAFLTDTLKQFVTDGDKKGEKVKLVKTFLCHVTKHYPKCCLTVLPLLQHLRSNEEFLTKLFTSLATKVPNAYSLKEPASLPWNVMPLIPISNEIQKFRYTKTNHLPKVRKDEKYDSVDQYLNTYFTLVREECFFKLKKGIMGFLNGKLDTKDLAMYRISFECVQFVQKPYVGGLSLTLKFEFIDPDQAKKSESNNIDWESYEYLKFGNLVCLSLDRSFRHPIWACVSENKELDRGFVSITMFKDRNMKSDLDVADVTCNLQELTERGVKAYMAESQTFYTAFRHTMEVLQEREKVPFQDSLVDGEIPGPAAYIKEATVRPDWSGVFSNTEEVPVQESTSKYDLLQDFYERKLKQDTTSKLDETQLAAVEVALKYKLALIQGPPGTGKTHVGLALLKLLHSLNVKQNRKLGPILVVTYKNLALNHFLINCLGMLPRKTVIVRIGSWAKTEGELRNCTIKEAAWKVKVKKSDTGKIESELEDLQMRLLVSSRKLNEANKFSSTVFMEEAEKEQIYSLLIGDGDTPGELPYAEAQKLVYRFAVDEQENSNGQLEEHVAKSLRKWLPACAETELGVDHPDFTGHPSTSTKSDGNEAREDAVGSSMEPSADERERLEAIGDEESDDQEVTKLPLEEKTPLPEWSMPIPPLTKETYVRCKHLLNTVNPWKLTQDERKQFAQVLMKRFRDRAKEEFLQIQQEYIAKHDQLQLLKRQFEARVLKKCDIIGMTVTGATMRSDILANVKPKIMIVEEAAEILEAQLLAAIPLSVEHLIMIGDQQQLKPQVHHPILRKRHHMDMSMFERLANLNLPLQQLGYQCRMREEFAELLNKLALYKNPINTNKELVAANHPPSCVKSSMFFQTHREPEKDYKDTHSKCNKREAVHVTKVAERLCKNGCGKEKITVLCSYRGQVNLIKRDFEREGLQDIAVETIDSFQGREQDVVLISLVRSKVKSIGYLASFNRLCVAISRARCGMYLFGNDLTLESFSGWRTIIGEMRKKRLTGNSFPFLEPGKQEIPKRNIGAKAARAENVGTIKKGTPDLNLLQELATFIIKERKRLGRALDLDDNILDAIEENEKDAYEKSYKILKRWKEIKGSEATFEALNKALRYTTVWRRDLAQKYCIENEGKPKQKDGTTRSVLAGKGTKPTQVVRPTITMTTVAVQEDGNLHSERLTDEDHKSVNDPLQESQQPHVKGDPHEEVGDVTDEDHKSDNDPLQESQEPHVKGDPHVEVGDVTSEDHKSVNDPLQESQEPHVKGDPHEEVGDVTDEDHKSDNDPLQESQEPHVKGDPHVEVGDVTSEDNKSVNDPLQESQEPHVKGDPHKEVGDVTDEDHKSDNDPLQESQEPHVKGDPHVEVGDVTSEDHKLVNDPLQESQEPHVKGDPHKEVGDLTDMEKKPRSERGNK